MQKPESKRASIWEVFTAFLKLGVTSFGGPIAHLGYFRAEFVTRRRWLSDEQYADLVALCQFLPGPASSQVGFGIGLQRAGLCGALAAFVAFTLPSAVLLFGFAWGAALIDGPVGLGMLSGLKVVAVAVVAQAVMGMAKTLTPDRIRAAIAVLGAGTCLVLGGTLGQILAIGIGAGAGLFWCRQKIESPSAPLRFPVSRTLGLSSLVLFTALLLLLPLAAAGGGAVALFDAFYRSGALVFGGGHVVLPLLQGAVVDTGWVSTQDFLSGYGLAQAVPGPLFTFASYLGAISDAGPGSAAGAAIALLGIFTPGFLLLLAVLPFWNTLAQRRWVRAVMRGANAAVVGILAAALYTPVFTGAVASAQHFVLALACFVLLVSFKLPPWTVVLFGALGGILIG